MFVPALTLALSPEEREQSLTGFGFTAGLPANTALGYPRALGTFLPLRWGEGRGEGKLDAIKDGHQI
jgi:hypothetical protein